MTRCTTNPTDDDSDVPRHMADNMLSLYRDSSMAHQAGTSALQKRLADSDRQLSQVRLALEQVDGNLQQHCWDNLA